MTHLAILWALVLAGACIFVHELCKVLFYPTRGHHLLRFVLCARVAAAALLAVAAALGIDSMVDEALTVLVLTQAIAGPWLWHLGMRLSDFLQGKSIELRGKQHVK